MILSHLTLSEPLWLAAGVLGVLAAWRQWRQRHPRWLSLIAPLAAWLLLAAALSRPQWQTSASRGRPLLLCIDNSASVRGLSPHLPFPSPQPTQTLYFGDTLLSQPTATSAAAADTTQTRLVPLLAFIAAKAGAISGAAIATDGQFTDDWQAAAKSLGRSVPLLIVPMSQDCEDARIADLSVQRANDGSAEISVSCLANRSLARQLVIRRKGLQQPLLDEQVQLLPNMPLRFLAVDRVAEDESAAYSAQLIGDTVITENDGASALLPARKTRIALVNLNLPTNWPAETARLSAAALSDDPDALAGFSAILLGDADGQRLSPSQRQALARYVQAGGVLVYAGPPAPLAGGDALQTLLPLVDGRYRRHPLSLRIVVDASGSMAQPAALAQRKFDLLSQAVLSLKGHLSERDSLAVVAFADEPHLAYDSHDAPADFAALSDALAHVNVGGSTRIIPAIEQALALEPSGREPMLLILSDLQTEAFDATAWARHISQANAKLAVVAVGQADEQPESQPLEALAKLLSAPYRQEAELKNLSDTFSQLIRQARGDWLLSWHGRLSLLGPLADMTPPAIDSFFVATLSPAGSLLGMAEADAPVIAQSSAGLGTCIHVALPFAGSVEERSSEPHLAARPEAGVANNAQPSLHPEDLAAWSALLWALVGPQVNASGDYDGQVVRDGDKFKLKLSAFHGQQSVNGLELAVHNWSEDDHADALPSQSASLSGGHASPPYAHIPSSVPMRQVAPGEYEALLPAAGPWPVAVAVQKAGQTIWRGSIAASAGPEFAHIGLNEDNLKTLSALTGAKIAWNDDAFAQLAKASQWLRPTRGDADNLALWPFLVSSALLLLLLNWAVLSRR